jgi:hypothetical protein
LTVQKGIDIYRSRQEQIEAIEKRRTLRKSIKRSKRNKENEDPSIQNYKRYKAKKDFESALNNEIKKVKEQKPMKRKSERNDTLEVSEEEDKIIIKFLSNWNEIFIIVLRKGFAKITSKWNTFFRNFL